MYYVTTARIVRDTLYKTSHSGLYRENIDWQGGPRCTKSAISTIRQSSELKDAITADRSHYVVFRLQQAAWPPGSADTVCLRPPLTLTLDLQTGMRVASKVQNLPSKLGHARPLSSRIIRYVRDGRTDTTDGRTKATLIPLPYGRGHNKCVYCLLYVSGGD